MHLKEKDEGGDPVRLFAFLVYQDGHFTGVIDVSPSGDMDGRLMSLTNARFNGATVETCQCMVWDFFGYKFYVMDAVSAPFTLPEAPSADRDLVLRMTKVSDIAEDAPTDLAGGILYAEAIRVALRNLEGALASLDALGFAVSARISYGRIMSVGVSPKHD
jgi:hypothetical protein